MQLNKLDFTVYIQILQNVSIYKKVQERLHMEQTCSYNDDLHKYRQSVSLFFKSLYDLLGIKRNTYSISSYDYLSIQQGQVIQTQTHTK